MYMVAFLWFLYRMSGNIQLEGNISIKVIEDIRLPYTLRGFSRPSDVARSV